VLHAVANQYPSATIDVLVRDASKSGAITKAYPKVNIVEGDLDNNDLLVKAAASADIVISMFRRALMMCFRRPRDAD